MIHTDDKRYYFDTNALWKFYREEKGALNIRRLVANSASPIFVSPLTRLEFFGVLMRNFHQGHLKRRDIKRIAERLIRDIKPEAQAHRFASTPLPENLFQLAEAILLQYGSHFSISSNDSLHLAIVTNLQSTLPDIHIVTSDGGMRNICQKMSLACYNPEIDMYY